MRAESRVRLLNYISKSPLDCPVALVFGHAGAMNWAGASYNDVGMELADKLWQDGYPADLIPSSEIENGNLYIDDDGWICYGTQRYAAVVLYHPEFEKPSTSSFFNKAQEGPTTLFRVGNWTKDFNGQTINGEKELPNTMVESEINSVVPEITTALQKQNILPQTPAISQLTGFLHTSSSPPATGFCRLIDGTIIQIAGTDSVSGDPIQSKISIGDYDVTFDAIGVAAVRLDVKGRVEAMAAGGLKHFKVKDFEIKLDKEVDIALWMDKKGNWKGVLQGWNGAIPAQLMTITKDWIRINVPVPL
jgi:hypothetical protein